MELVLDNEELELLLEAREALENKSENLQLSNEHLICECLCISAGEIREILNNRKICIDILSQELNLGSGCSSCLKAFKQWKDKI